MAECIQCIRTELNYADNEMIISCNVASEIALTIVNCNRSVQAEHIKGNGTGSSPLAALTVESWGLMRCISKNEISSSKGKQSKVPISSQLSTLSGLRKYTKSNKYLGRDEIQPSDLICAIDWFYWRKRCDNVLSSMHLSVAACSEASYAYNVRLFQRRNKNKEKNGSTLCAFDNIVVWLAQHIAQLAEMQLNCNSSIPSLSLSAQRQRRLKMLRSMHVRHEVKEVNASVRYRTVFVVATNADEATVYSCIYVHGYIRVHVVIGVVRCATIIC